MAGHAVGEEEVQRQLDPQTRGDRLLAAVAALVMATKAKQAGGDVRKFVADDVVVHGDTTGTFFKEDKVGLDAFLSAPQHYGDRYTVGARRIVATALTPDEGAAFCFWCDEGVTPSEAYRAQLQRGGAASKDEGAACARLGSNVAGLWLARGDADGRVAEMWLFRQLTAQERAAHFKDPSTPFTDFDASKYMEPSELPADERREAALLDAARKFDGMWQAGSVDAAGDIMGEALHSYDLLFGHASASRSEWVNKHAQMFKSDDYQRYVGGQHRTSTVAAARHSNKAFIYWAVEPANGGRRMSGMNMLVCDEASRRVTDVVGFRTPASSEETALMTGAPLDAGSKEA